LTPAAYRSVVPTPVTDSGTAMLNSVPAQGGQVWAVGQLDSAAAGGRPLVYHFDGSTWQIVSLPSSVGSSWTSLWGVTAAGGDVWAVGTDLDLKTDNDLPLLLDDHGGQWKVDRGPVPGSGSNILGGVTAIGATAYAVGVYDNGGSALPFIERH
jgi:hypothetical protein